MLNTKELAGRRAAEFVVDGMKVGLGTGSTVFFTLVRLGERVASDGLRIVGVPTSVDTEKKAREFGIPLIGLDDVARLDLTIDGADEIDANFAMIKGGGGALLREKVVASISARVAIVVGEDKVVERLNQKFLLPIEVVPFAAAVVSRELEKLGAKPRLRRRSDESTFVTDNHNWILDCKFEGGIADPRALDPRLRAIPGVVETGLFIDLAQVLIVGRANGEVLVREKPRR